MKSSSPAIAATSASHLVDAPEGGRPRRHRRATSACSTAAAGSRCTQRRPRADRATSARSTARDLEGYDCVMHLAAISNDPMGDLDPKLTLAINRDALDPAGAAGQARPACRASCSRQLLGLRPGRDARPRRERRAEPAHRLRASRRSRPKPAIARAGRRRLLARSPAQRDRVRPFADAAHRPRRQQPARLRARHRRDPHHERRLAVAAADPLPRHRPRVRRLRRGARASASHNVAVNVGANAENYQVRDVAAIVQRLLPGPEIVFTGEVGADPRDYRVNFDRLGGLLPDFRLEYTLRHRHGGAAGALPRARLLARRLRRPAVRPAALARREAGADRGVAGAHGAAPAVGAEPAGADR